MAVNKTINKRTNTHGAMRNCIEYVLRQDKTGKLLTYITGPYCHDEINYDLVYRTFLEEKKMWNKDTGRMYVHNIISWHKDEQITSEQALEFGKEFAEKWFSGFQTLVAVHKDKEHIHCHLVTNSVSYEDGRKLHNTKKDLERMKQLTNQMCRERGLTVAEKGKHFDGSQIEKGEVIAWSKDKYNLFRQAEIARRSSEINRRNSASDNRTVRNAETESIASAEQRRSEKQKWLNEQERARAARRRNKRRSGPEL